MIEPPCKPVPSILLPKQTKRTPIMIAGFSPSRPWRFRPRLPGPPHACSASAGARCSGWPPPWPQKNEAAARKWHPQTPPPPPPYGPKPVTPHPQTPNPKHPTPPKPPTPNPQPPPHPLSFAICSAPAMNPPSSTGGKDPAPPRRHSAPASRRRRWRPPAPPAPPAALPCGCSAAHGETERDRGLQTSGGLKGNDVDP